MNGYHPLKGLRCFVVIHPATRGCFSFPTHCCAILTIRYHRMEVFSPSRTVANLIVGSAKGEEAENFHFEWQRLHDHFLGCFSFEYNVTGLFH